MKNIIRITGLILLIFILHSCKKDKPTPPIITTTNVTEVSYTTATSGGNVTNEGSSAILSMGICWNTSPSPTIENSKTSENVGLGAFVSSMTHLVQNTKYYVRGYATNSVGISFGNEVTFTTSQIAVPVLTTTVITSITQTNAVSGGNISDDKGGSVTSRGICWGTLVNPTIANDKTTDGEGTGSFVSNLTGLVGNTLYYVRAYATNSVGTQYGNQVNFTTSPLMPTLTTTSISSITQTIASSGGNVTNDGGAAVSARGICWNTISGPTTSNSKTIEGTGTGIFTSSMTGLTANTTYYLRAYATNSVGTAYGSEISFTTLPPTPPIITTTEVSSISTTTANSGGSVTSDGGSQIMVRGVCWNTAPNPTIDNNKTSNGTGIGNFTSNITSLIPNATYYLRSYATNNVGTSYGIELTFKMFAVIDADGNGYYSVTIGTQTWILENLKTTKYNNGNIIGTTTPATLDISAETTPKYQWAYDGDESNVATYGRLYTWYAVTDSRNVCPIEWHVPTDADWTNLTTYLGGESIAGGKLKETGTIHWQSPNTGATNESGFSALPGGYRNNTGPFWWIKFNANWWSSSEFNTLASLGTRYLHNDDIIVYTSNDVKYSGHSVRCLKDN